MLEHIQSVKDLGVTIIITISYKFHIGIIHYFCC